VVAALSEVPEVKPLLWTECFKLGDITFLGIENIARRVAGAVFLATPDDDSVIREQRVRTPRANVLFEYGYLSAMLTRGRVASDFAGVTYVPMAVRAKQGPRSSSESQVEIMGDGAPRHPGWILADVSNAWLFRVLAN
jgi:predicted nucleotide-binding protein